MPDNPLNQFKEDYFLLLEAGFLAVNDADEDSAKKLFHAAQILRPQEAFPKLGYGYLHFCKLEIKEATEKFKEVLAVEPENSIAKTLLGLCLSMGSSTMSKGEAMLESTMTETQDAGMKNLLHSAMDFVDKFLKKAPSPMAPKKPQQRAK